MQLSYSYNKCVVEEEEEYKLEDMDLQLLPLSVLMSLRLCRFMFTITSFGCFHLVEYSEYTYASNPIMNKYNRFNSTS